MTKQYLGDSVYAEVEDDRVKLTTDNGYGATSTIYLEPEVFDALKRWGGATMTKEILR